MDSGCLEHLLLMLYGGLLGLNALVDLLPIPAGLYFVTCSSEQKPSQKFAHSFMSIQIPSTSASLLMKSDNWENRKDNRNLISHNDDPSFCRGTYLALPVRLGLWVEEVGEVHVSRPHLTLQVVSVSVLQ